MKFEPIFDASDDVLVALNKMFISIHDIEKPKKGSKEEIRLSKILEKILHDTRRACIHIGNARTTVNEQRYK